MGKLTVPAIFAAAECPEISVSYLSSGLVSFRSLVELEEYSHTLANFIPSFLQHADLPDVAASAAPRKLILAGAVDATDKPVAATAVRSFYSKASNIEVREKAVWDLEALVGIAEPV
jgi:hypothetical protein